MNYPKQRFTYSRREDIEMEEFVKKNRGNGMNVSFWKLASNNEILKQHSADSLRCHWRQLVFNKEHQTEKSKHQAHKIAVPYQKIEDISNPTNLISEPLENINPANFIKLKNELKHEQFENFDPISQNSSDISIPVLNSPENIFHKITNNINSLSKTDKSKAKNIKTEESNKKIKINLIKIEESQIKSKSDFLKNEEEINEIKYNIEENIINKTGQEEINIKYDEINYFNREEIIKEDDFGNKVDYSFISSDKSVNVCSQDFYFIDETPELKRKLSSIPNSSIRKKQPINQVLKEQLIEELFNNLLWICDTVQRRKASNINEYNQNLILPQHVLGILIKYNGDVQQTINFFK